MTAVSASVMIATRENTPSPGSSPHAESWSTPLHPSHGEDSVEHDASERLSWLSSSDDCSRLSASDPRGLDSFPFSSSNTSPALFLWEELLFMRRTGLPSMQMPFL